MNIKRIFVLGLLGSSAASPIVKREYSGTVSKITGDNLGCTVQTGDIYLTNPAASDVISQVAAGPLIPTSTRPCTTEEKNNLGFPDTTDPAVTKVVRSSYVNEIPMPSRGETVRSVNLLTKQTESGCHTTGQVTFLDGTSSLINQAGACASPLKKRSHVEKTFNTTKNAVLEFINRRLKSSALRLTFR